VVGVRPLYSEGSPAEEHRRSIAAQYFHRGHRSKRSAQRTPTDQSLACGHYSKGERLLKKLRRYINRLRYPNDIMRLISGGKAREDARRPGAGCEQALPHGLRQLPEELGVQPAHACWQGLNHYAPNRARYRVDYGTITGRSWV
jgi:hypothetical protein